MQLKLFRVSILSGEVQVELIASDIDEEVGKITTSSPEALKLFSDGMNFRYLADYRQSIRFLERAIAIDPQFALAYRAVALNYGDIGYRSRRIKYLQKALELSDRVSDRELYLIQGDFYSQSERTYDKAIEAYHKFIELYTEDENGKSMLGNLYADNEEWDKALELFEANHKNKVENVNLYYDLVRVYIGKGLYDKARNVSEEYIENFQDNSLIRRDIAQTYLAQGKYGLALKEVDKAFFLFPPIYSPYRVKGQIYLLQEEFLKAEEQFLKMLNLEEKAANSNGISNLGHLYLSQGRITESRNMFKQGVELTENIGEVQTYSNFHLYLAKCYILSGNFEDALKECIIASSGFVEVGRLSLQNNALLIKGLIYLDMNEIDKAKRVSVELRKTLENSMNKKSIRLYYNLMGRIELKRENFSKAIENLKKAISLLPFQQHLGSHALYIESLALACYRSGDFENAQNEYVKITRLTSGRIYFGDIYAKSFYMLGKIHEQQSNRAKAIENYEKFLSLWKDADPGLPEVDDARKRLAGLKRE